jgi:CRISPR-associated endonuclease/helicase Cas3
VHIKDSAQHDRRLEAAIEKARSEMPDKGKWSVLVPLRLKEDGTWLGRASNERGDVGVLYDPKTGLRVVPPAKDGDES